MALNNLDKLSEDAIKSLHNKRLGKNKKRTDLDIGLSNELVEECLKMDLNREREKKTVGQCSPGNAERSGGESQVSIGRPPLQPIR